MPKKLLASHHVVIIETPNANRVVQRA